MTISITLNGTTLPLPVKCAPTRDPVGTQFERADGTLATRRLSAGTRRRSWSLEWQDLTEANADIVRDAWDAAIAGAVAFKPLNEESTTNVVAGPLSEDESYADGAIHSTLRGQLREVTPS